MKKLTAMLMAAGIVVGASPAVMAEDGTSYNVAVTNNYMWRGATQTSNGVALQGGLDHTAGNMSFGVWASNVDFGTATTKGFEIDFYGSYAINDKASVGAIYYYYTDSGNAAFSEINGSYDFGVASAGLAYNLDAGGGNSIYLEVGGSAEVSKGVNFDWHLGNASGGTSVSDYSVGVSGAFSGVDVSAAYINNTGAGAQGQFVVTAGKTF